MKCRRSVMVLVLLSATILLGLAGPASAVQVYFNDFSTSVGPGWSATSGPLLITTAPDSPNEKFLGTDATYGLTANTVTLTLSSLPAHTSLTLGFDLYIIQSWDGNDSTYGPDYFKLSIAGSTLLDTTFSNLPRFNQSYPNNYPGNNAFQTGATAIGTLTYPWFDGTDATYHLTYTLPNTASSVVINFQNYGPVVQGYGDESWGLDNVKVDVVPVPPTLLLLGSGLMGLGLLRRKWSLKK